MPDLDQTIQSLLELARDLEVKIQTQFKESFALINERFDAFSKSFQWRAIKLVLTSEAADEKEDEQTSAAPESPKRVPPR